MRRMFVWLGLASIVSWVVVPLDQANGETSQRVATGRRGVVVSAHPAASEAGVAILDAGGNAIDAAVATAFALAVVEPFSAGVGGGGFLIHRNARTRKVTVVDYREFAPRRARRDMYLRDGAVAPNLSIDGILSVAVPTMVPGLAEAERRLGRKKLSEVLDPAIALAQGGFIVPATFHDASVERLELLRGNEAARRVFLKDGVPFAVGDRIVQEDLARTLLDLKRAGPSLFVHGRIAKAIVKESERLGGILTLSDLRAFRVRYRTALEGSYRGHTVITMPPPSSGGTHLLQILKLLEIDRLQRNAGEERKSEAHILVESMRRAYADRALYMGDPAFVAIPLKRLLADDYLRSRYASIDPVHASLSADVTAGSVDKVGAEPNETTHISVIDADGNAVALTQTVNYRFGSGVVVPGTGVLLNDEMDDFSAAPGVANAYGLVGGEANSILPRKIPLSSMTPTLVVKDGAVRLVVGAPGGSTIITTVLQIILHVVDDGMGIGDAVKAPRLHMQWLPDEVRLEPGALDERTRQVLLERGHRLVEKRPWGNASAIEVLQDGMRVGAADPRGDGEARAQGERN